MSRVTTDDCNSRGPGATLNTLHKPPLWWHALTPSSVNAAPGPVRCPAAPDQAAIITHVLVPLTVPEARVGVAAQPVQRAAVVWVFQG